VVFKPDRTLWEFLSLALFTDLLARSSSRNFQEADLFAKRPVEFKNIPSTENMGSKGRLAQKARDIKTYLEGTEQELKGVEAALELDNNNPFLLQKYDRLSKKEQQLMEERKLWTGELARPRSEAALLCVLFAVWRQS
jgi:hypothetical protein